MSTSILDTVKKQLGITEDYRAFDDQLIVDINSAFFVLRQLGVGPEEGFAIDGSSTEWRDFLGDGANLELVKTYISMRVRQSFDPPQSSAAMDALKRQIDEFEWRLNVEVDHS